MVVVQAQLTPATFIIAQQDSPIAVRTYAAEADRLAAVASESDTAGIAHTVAYRNTIGQRVVAVQFGFVAFNVFDEVLEYRAGLTLRELDAGADRTDRWVFRGPARFSFLAGAVFVHKVRFESGEIWRADMETVIESLGAIGDVSGLRGLSRQP